MRVREWAAGAAAISAAGVMGLTGIALITPASPTAQAATTFLPLAEPHAAAARRALAQGDFPIARAETRAELSIAPVREDAWLRLVKLDILQHHRLSPEGAAALSHSYDALPYDLNPESERIPIALANLEDMPPSLQSSAWDELRVWASSHTLRRRLLSLMIRTEDRSMRAAIRRLTLIEPPPAAID